LALPYAAPTFGAALVGRLSYGLLPLSVLFTVQQSTGSFATAGGVVAVFGLTSILLPLKSRLVDRHGQASVLAPLALLCAGALAAMAFLAWSGSAPAPAYLALGIVAGLGAPPLGPAMRSTWRTITDGSSLKQRAYSLDSVCEESLYLIGPLLFGVSLSVASPPAALLAAASLMLVGTLGMVWMPPAQQIRSAGSTAPLRFDLGPLAAPGFWPVVVAMLATAVGLNMAFTSIAARAQTQGLPAVAGYIEAAIALGSVAGGLLWGRRRHTRTHSTYLRGPRRSPRHRYRHLRCSDKPYSAGHPHGGHGPGHSPALRRLLSGRRRAGTRTPADRGKHLGQHREQHWQRRRRLQWQAYSSTAPAFRSDSPSAG